MKANSSLLAVVVAVFSPFSTSHAAPLAIDFGGNGTTVNQRVQPGFVEVSGSATGFLPPIFSVPPAALPDGKRREPHTSCNVATRVRRTERPIFAPWPALGGRSLEVWTPSQVGKRHRSSQLAQRVSLT